MLFKVAVINPWRYAWQSCRLSLFSTTKHVWNQCRLRRLTHLLLFFFLETFQTRKQDFKTYSFLPAQVLYFKKTATIWSKSLYTIMVYLPRWICFFLNPLLNWLHLLWASYSYFQMQFNILSVVMFPLSALSLWFLYANNDQCLSSFTPD